MRSGGPPGHAEQNCEQPLTEAVLDRSGPGVDPNQRYRTPHDLNDQNIPDPPRRPFHPSLARRGDVPGYTDDKQGFTALLRVADRAQGQGRPIAAAS